MNLHSTAPAFAWIITSDSTPARSAGTFHPSNAPEDTRRALSTPGEHLHPFQLVDETGAPLAEGLGYWERREDIGSEPGTVEPIAHTEIPFAVEVIWEEWPPEDEFTPDGAPRYAPTFPTPAEATQRAALMLAPLAQANRLPFTPQAAE